MLRIATFTTFSGIGIFYETAFEKFYLLDKLKLNVMQYRRDNYGQPENIIGPIYYYQIWQDINQYQNKIIEQYLQYNAVCKQQSQRKKIPSDIDLKISSKRLIYLPDKWPYIFTRISHIQKKLFSQIERYQRPSYLVSRIC